MAAIKTVGDNMGWCVVMTTAPADPTAITVAELTAGIDATFSAAASGTRFSFTASDTTSDPMYGDSSNATITTRSNYEGTIAPVLLLDDTTEAYTALDNDLYEALKEKGTTIYVASGITGDPAAARAAGDVYDYFVFTTDNPQQPTDVGGYRKRIVPLNPAGTAIADGVVAA